ITTYAVEQLGDVTLVDLPEPGAELHVGERFGDVESVKTVSELLSPVSGEVVAVNEALGDSPELVNQGPYTDGWMVAIRVSNLAELDELMDAATYETFVGGLDH